MPSLKPYPAYADTDLPWLPKIPKHWEVQRAKWQFSDSIDKNHPEETLLSVTQGQGVVARSEAEMRVWNPGDDISGYKLVEPNEFVISLRSFEGGIEISYVRGIVSPAYVVLHPVHKEYNEYFRHLFKSRDFISLLNISTSGIRQGKNITFWDFRELSIPIPPLPEQRTIAAYLDRQTAKIDALIAKKQRLLDLLAEQRAALISQAVTKGLNPAVKMKDSGVAWLGQVPSHWEVNLVKRHFDIDLGKMLDSSKQPEHGVLKPYLRAANIYWEGAWIDDVKEMKFTKEQLKRYRLQTGDLLVTEGGATVGRSAIWQGELEEVYYQNSINRARPKGTLPVKFLYYWLYALKLTGFLDNVISKATFGHLTKDKLQLLQMTVPPKQEAEEIAKHIDIKLAYFARVENKINDVIARLQEYRAALISSVVTGKVDVSAL